MIKTLPYDERTTSYKWGGYFKPNGGILLNSANGDHEILAEEYCLGINHDLKEGKLDSSDLALCQKWLELRSKKQDYQLNDFLVKVLGFDIFQKKYQNMIVTSSLEPHIRFYNYYLMDFLIVSTPKLVLKENKFVSQSKSLILSYRDMETEDELDEIKAKVLSKKERQLFFR